MRFEPEYEAIGVGSVYTFYESNDCVAMTAYFKPFWIPALLFISVILISVRYDGFWLNYRDVLLVLPYILFSAAAVVSLYLLQYAFFYTSVLFMAVYALIQLYLQTTLSDPVTYVTYLFANLMFPVLLMSCVLLGRKALFSPWSISLLVCISSLVWGPWLLTEMGAADQLFRLSPRLSQPLFEDTWFGVGLLVTYVPVLCFIVALYVLNPTLLQANWLVGWLTVLMVFLFFSVRLISALAFSVYSFLLLIALLQEAFLLAYVDELTGIPGRKALEKQMLSLGRRYSIAMLDVDHFKKFNDTHGHDVGDQVLRMVAAKINQVTGGGKAYRYGGEEFTILFPGKTAEQTIPHLEAVRSTIAEYTMQLRDDHRPKDDKEGKKHRAGQKNTGVNVTISLGVATKSDAQSSPEAVIKAADKALYSAKNAGRNCVKSA